MVSVFVRITLAIADLKCRHILLVNFRTLRSLVVDFGAQQQNDCRLTLTYFVVLMEIFGSKHLSSLQAHDRSVILDLLS